MTHSQHTSSLLASKAPFFVLGICSLVLLGWIFSSDTLVTLGKSGSAMVPTTAVSLALFAFAKFQLDMPRACTAMILASVVISALGLVNGMSTVGFLPQRAGYEAYAVSPATFLCCVYAASAYFLFRLRNKRASALAMILTSTGMLTAVYALVSNLLHGMSYNAIPVFATMSMPTALCYLVVFLWVLDHQFRARIEADQHAHEYSDSFALSMPLLISPVVFVYASIASDRDPASTVEEPTALLGVLLAIVISSALFFLIRGRYKATDSFDF